MALPFNFFQRQQQPAAAPAYNPFQALVQRQAQRQAAQSASFAERQAAQQAAFAQQAKGFGAGAPQQRSPISTMPVIGQTPMPQPGLQPMPQPGLQPMPQPGLQPQMPQQQSPGMAIQYYQLRQQLTNNPYVQQQNQLQQQMQNLQAQAFSAANFNPAYLNTLEGSRQAQAIMQQLESSPQYQALQQQGQQLNQQMQNDPSFMAMNQQMNQLGQQLNQQEILRQQQLQQVRQQPMQTTVALGPQDFLAQKQIAQPLSASTMAEQASLQAARARMLGGGQGLVPQPQGPQALQPTQSSMLGNMAQNFPGTLGQAPAQGGLGNFMPTQTGLMNAPVGTPQQLPPGFNASPIRSDIDQTAMMNNMLAQQAQQPSFNAVPGQAMSMSSVNPQTREAMTRYQLAQQAQQPNFNAVPGQPMGAQQAQPQVMGLRQGFNMAGPQAMQSLGGASQQASQPQRLGGI